MASTGTTPRSRRSSNNQMGVAAGPAPSTKPPTPPQGIRTPGGTLVKRASDYKTPPAVAPPQVSFNVRLSKSKLVLWYIVIHASISYEKGYFVDTWGNA